ncbi:hypothetical protein PHLCEN_2v11926 [Hermanssonia centrifuga]|uniref:Uncharacterized protein n=1 Tax=Hermanssonia centrifuga TaxID=98765 RepID=A0A2R6NIM9_9APHY|nr:hypothetical protein PHLCEN_2v11926 [Hermanssonia centrifuga]
MEVKSAQEIEAAIEYRYYEIAELKSRINTFSLINQRLPPELLAEVFHHYMPGEMCLTDHKPLHEDHPYDISVDLGSNNWLKAFKQMENLLVLRANGISADCLSEVLTTRQSQTSTLERRGERLKKTLRKRKARRLPWRKLSITGAYNFSVGDMNKLVALMKFLEWDSMEKLVDQDESEDDGEFRWGRG